MKNAKVYSCLEHVLQTYGFSTKIKDSHIIFKGSSAWGSLYIGTIDNYPLLELSYKDKFHEILAGDLEKERFAGANTFSKYANANCMFCYTPPNVYSFTSRMLGNFMSDLNAIEQNVRYMVCACIEGFAFLDSAGYYNNPKERNILNREIHDNLHSLSPWSDPGSLATTQ